MFTQECFIRCCDKELIDALKELGYKDYTIHIKQLFQGITTTKDGQILGSNIPTTINSTCYDCGENKELFLALVAMRDDSDKDQYFVRDEEQRWRDANGWNIIKKGSLEKSLIDDYSKFLTSREVYDTVTNELIMTVPGPKMHKASAQEIINYFTKKYK
jgi:L-rhamnose mutarotase